ncbi:MAG TPA: c-type cytochrome [Gaiellaceae bacterium]|nr:c-type cytochrome [Gaiellaceae bacterium]
MAVVVVPPFDPARYAERGAVGLMVPGIGATVTRASALAALERGKATNTRLGGTPHGRILVRPSKEPGSQVTLYVSLPPPGRTPNQHRYPVAVVGCRFHGVLTSSVTRLRGLIFVADVAPAAVHLGDGGCRASPLGWRPSKDAGGELQRLDRRIARVHDARGWTVVAVIVTVGVLGLFGSPGVIGCVTAVVASLVLSAAGVGGFWALLLGVVGITVALALALPTRRIAPLMIVAFFVAFLCVLLVDTRINSLAVLGARPDSGARFYGVTNELETLLLAPTLVAAAAEGLPWFVGVAALALVTVGWSSAGADGGGLVVYAVALTVLAVRLRGVALTVRSAVAVAVGVVALVLALVGLDAALGGSSHVTHAVGTGPGSALGDLGRRLHLSYLAVTSSWGSGAEFLAGLAVLVGVAAVSARGPRMQAFLAALAVSFVVNDTPIDIAALGALGCWTLARWETVDSRAMRRPVVLFAAVVLVLTAAGCGSEGAVRALPNTVVGTVKLAAPGKGLFTSNGCNGCHTYKPANSTGTIGPDLGKLPQYAKQAKQPLDKFVRQSISDPNAYVQPGFPKGVMPSFKQLSASDLNDLVQFLTKPSG